MIFKFVFKFIARWIWVLVAFLIVGGAVKKHWYERELLIRIYQHVRWRYFLEILVVFVLTVTGAIILMQVPYLKYGWLHLFTEHGGNILTGPVLEMGTQDEGMTKSTEIALKSIATLFFLTLGFILPFFAKDEEEMFRRGVHNWGAIIPTSIVFGLMHLIVGIPLAAGLALTIPGLYFGWVYKRSFERAITRGDTIEMAMDYGVLRSSAAHTVYNQMLVTVIIVIIWSTFGS